MLTKETSKEVVTSYSKLLNAGNNYGKALAKAAEELAGKPCPQLLKELATVHAAFFRKETGECNLSWSSSGTPQFHTGDKSTRETKHHNAYKVWSRYAAPHFAVKANKKKVKPSERKEVDRVTALAKDIKAKTKNWSAKEKKALFAALI